MNITLRRHERCNFPDYSPAHHRRQITRPNPFHHIIGVKSPSPSGLTGVSTYPCTPYFYPHPQTYRHANSDGVSYSARTGQLPPAAPAITYWHQSVTLWSNLPKAITLPMPRPGCPPGGADRQAGREATGDYPGCPLYAPKRTFLDSA
jgi:hypothetical protein